MSELHAPVDRQINNLKQEIKVLAKQNENFINLYRDCLADFREEVLAKKNILES